MTMARGLERNGHSSRRSRNHQSSPNLVFRFVFVGIIIVNCNVFWVGMYLLNSRETPSQLLQTPYVKASRVLRLRDSIEDQTRMLGEEALEKIIARGTDATGAAPTRDKLLSHLSSKQKIAEKRKQVWKFPPLVETVTGTDVHNNTIWEVIPERHWWNPWIEYASRAYPEYQGGKYSWCIPEEHHSPKRIKNAKEKAFGLLFVKPYKVAASMGEGININIARHVGQRLMSMKMKVETNNQTKSNQTLAVSDSHPIATAKAPPCIHYDRHEFSDHKNQGSRGSPSLLWTMVRRPTDRDLSEVFFQHVSRKNVTSTDDHVIRILAGIKNRQSRYLTPSWESVRKLDQALAPHRHSTHAIADDETNKASIAKIIKKDIIGYYDFIGVIERMDESLAVMKLLFDLETSDLIVLFEKSQHEGLGLEVGGYDDGSTHDKQTGKLRCVPIRQARVTPKVHEYLQTEHAERNADYFLYEAAVQSLDMTIEKLGRHRVHAVVEELRKLQYLAETMCRQMADFPCSESGKLQLEKAKRSCYVQDVGCGYQCVDHIMNQYRQGIIGNVVRGKSQFLIDDNKDIAEI